MYEESSGAITADPYHAVQVHLPGLTAFAVWFRRSGGGWTAGGPLTVFAVPEWELAWTGAAWTVRQSSAVFGADDAATALAYAAVATAGFRRVRAKADRRNRQIDRAPKVD